MYPKLISFETPDFLKFILPDHITVYSYGVMIALGILSAYFIVKYKTKDIPLSSDKISSLLIWVIVAAFIGGKLFFFLENPQRYIDDPSEIINAAGGGFVFYGSLIFAIPTIIWWLRKEKLAVRSFFDILAFAGPVVHSFGRIGCFMAGCCHGRVCDAVYGVVFDHPETMADPMNTPLYPTQLYDIAVNLIILITVLLLQRRKQFEGQLFLVYLMMYGVGRSIVEMFRGDEARGYVIEGVLTHSQFIAVLIILASVFVWRRWSKFTGSDAKFKF